MTKEADRWLAKKAKKAQYWQVKRFLESLRLKYIEKDAEKISYSISAPLFGLRFRFNTIGEAEDRGWKVFFLDLEKLEVIPDYFREDVMWFLVSRGYLSYIRDAEVGSHGRIFRSFVVSGGWGAKIMKKRLEIYGTLPEYTYLRLKTEEFLTLPIPKIIAHFPGFFDYLV